MSGNLQYWDKVLYKGEGVKLDLNKRADYFEAPAKLGLRC